MSAIMTRVVGNFRSRPSIPITLPKCVFGAVSGSIATWPMTALMRTLFRRLPEEERYPLPPRLITMNVASKAGVAHKMDEEARFTVTMVAHYAYGAAAGAVFAAIPPRTKIDVVSRGIGFGLAVWGISYLGLLPGIGLFPPAAQQPLRRNGLMIAAHIVWGVTLSVLEQIFRRTMQSDRARPRAPTHQKSPARTPRRPRSKRS
jgi:uncharacterized membrane protein YagU involved in acid resistance